MGSSRIKTCGSCETASNSDSFTNVPFDRCLTFLLTSSRNSSTISRHVWSFHVV